MQQADIDEMVHTVQSLMRGFPAPWCVAGGWALDLFLGRVTRAHSDVEVAIFRQDQARLHSQFVNWTFHKVADGQRKIWSASDFLMLPVHEIHARSADDPPHTIEFLLNERDDACWIFRRNISIHLPLEHAIVRVSAGLPVLCPAIVLLFKAKAPRPRDEADFQATIHEMDRARRAWLHSVLQVRHPGQTPARQPIIRSAAGDDPSSSFAGLPRGFAGMTTIEGHDEHM